MNIEICIHPSILPIHHANESGYTKVTFRMMDSSRIYIYFCDVHMLIYAMNNSVDITTDHKTSCVHIGIDKKINMSSRGFIDDMNI